MKIPRARGVRVAALLLAMAPAPAVADVDDERAALVAEIEREVLATRNYTGRSHLGRHVMRAIASVPRHEFVPTQWRALAYANQSLPIGEGQTISQPYIVALMTDLADVDEHSVVLEIGTGSGYQAAVLAEIVQHVYTIEIVEPLGHRAAATLARLGYDNVSVRIGDGYAGWPEHAPFDAILVTAAPETVPEPLLQQLGPGGRLIAPVGTEHSAQSLQVVEKDDAGVVTVIDVLPVMFVPFTRSEPN